MGGEARMEKIESVLAVLFLLLPLVELVERQVCHYAEIGAPSDLPGVRGLGNQTT